MTVDPNGKRDLSIENSISFDLSRAKSLVCRVQEVFTKFPGNLVSFFETATGLKHEACRASQCDLKMTSYCTGQLSYGT